MKPGGPEPEPGRPRVFGIGLNKTGTSSFHAAMTLLGFESLHWGGPPIRHTVEASLASGRPLLSDLDPRYDAFSDILALSTNFALLDAQYPGSRFVLTVRPVDSWIDSRRRHVETNIRRKAAGEYDGTFLVVDEAATSPVAPTTSSSTSRRRRAGNRSARCSVCPCRLRPIRGRIVMPSPRSAA